jgi:outer membrane protein OmpA-like peptidoglycan-associated protein
MSSILDMVRDAVPAEATNRISSMIGESPAVTQKAFGAAVPAILAGAAERAATPGGAERLRTMITAGGYGGGMLDNLAGLAGGGGVSDIVQGGGRILSSLFGGRLDGMTEALAGFAGMRRGSASSLLAMAAPIVMSVLGKQVASRGLDASGLMNLLSGQRGAITNALPAGLAGALGGREAAAATVTPPPVESTSTLARDRFADEEIVEHGRRPGTRVWPYVLAGLAALALLFLFTRGRVPEVATTAPPAPTTQAPAASIREPASVSLPDGRQLSVNRGGFLDQVNTYLAGKSGGEPPKRFVFDDLNFEAASTTLTPQSNVTVDSLAAILKAYPSAEATLEGHTDATGDAGANKKLSLDRAEAVKSMLVQAGVPANRLSVSGHGQERPMAPNDTDEGRARNRRTELVVMKR